MVEYITLFDDLMHQLLAHDPLVNPAILTGKFIDGLKPEIRAALLLHKPKDLDTTSSLAILQEEVLAGPVVRDFKKLDSSGSHKAAVRATTTSGTVPAQPWIGKPSVSDPIAKPNEKLSALMTYRKARGLCFKCGGKWGPQHKCLATVPLNIIEEVWQFLEKYADCSNESNSDLDPDELMALSDQAVKGTCVAHTLKIHAYIHQKPAIIFVDSRSSHNFISEHMAADLHPWTPLKHSMSIKVADGATLVCSHEVVNCSWTVQGVMFTTTFKILPL